MHEVNLLPAVNYHMSVHRKRDTEPDIVRETAAQCLPSGASTVLDRMNNSLGIPSVASSGGVTFREVLAVQLTSDKFLSGAQ